MKKKIFKLFVCVVCIFFLAGCGSKEETNKDYEDKINDMYKDYEDKINEAISTVKVPLAAEDIPSNTFITVEMIIVEEFSEDQVDENVITSMGAIVGKTTAKDIKKGSSFQESDLID